MTAALLGLFIMIVATAWLRVQTIEPFQADTTELRQMTEPRQAPYPAFDPLAFWLFPDWQAAGDRPCWMVAPKP